VSGREGVALDMAMGFGEGFRSPVQASFIKGERVCAINTAHPTKDKGHRTPPVVSRFRPAKHVLEGAYSAFGLVRNG